MEKDLKNKSNFTLEDYYELEKKILNHINEIFPITLKKLKEDSLFKELKFNESAVTPYFIFNKKSVKSINQGDINSNTLWKFQHEIFPKSEFDEECKNSEMLEKDFLKKLGYDLIMDLNNSIPTDLEKLVAKYEVKNNYFNVYFKSLAKEFIDKRVEDSKPKPVHDSFTIQPIGTLHSCFPEKFSVPRQGGLLSKTKGKIVFDPKVIEPSCIDGINEFEYFWVVYIFHLHTEFKGTKISPPKRDKNSVKKDNDKAIDLKDESNTEDNKNKCKERLGIFATRTPHRLNPIGLTLVKLEKVENNEMYISGIDMVNGTPIVDIKPYHHLESLDMNSVKYPNWILNADKDVEIQRNKVEFSEQSLNSLKQYVDEDLLDFYHSYEEIFDLIKDLLEIDPHSKYTKTKIGTLVYAFYVDKLNIIYEFNAVDKYIKVQNIEYVEEYRKLRNKDWLKQYNQNKENIQDKESSLENIQNKESKDK